MATAQTEQEQRAKTEICLTSFVHKVFFIQRIFKNDPAQDYEVTMTSFLKTLPVSFLYEETHVMNLFWKIKRQKF